MKTITTFVFAAAAMAVAAGSASAQTIMKAEVPFAFRAGKAMMQPGQYEVKVGPNSLISMHNVDTRKSAFAPAIAAADHDKAWKDGLPRMAFECSEGNCALLAVYTGEGESALKFRGLQSKGSDAHIAMVPFKAVRK